MVYFMVSATDGSKGKLAALFEIKLHFVYWQHCLKSNYTLCKQHTAITLWTVSHERVNLFLKLLATFLPSCEHRTIHSMDCPFLVKGNYVSTEGLHIPSPFIYLIDLLKAYSPVIRTGSPQGFSLVQVLHKSIKSI